MSRRTWKKTYREELKGPFADYLPRIYDQKKEKFLETIIAQNERENLSVPTVLIPEVNYEEKKEGLQVVAEIWGAKISAYSPFDLLSWNLPFKESSDETNEISEDAAKNLQASLAGKFIITNFLDKYIEAIECSELQIQLGDALKEDSVIISFSQSGETIDLIEAIR